MRDYTLGEVQVLKKALEDQILQGLSKKISEFTQETGLAVGGIRVEFIDVSTLQQQEYLPHWVKVRIVHNNMVISNVGGINGKGTEG